MFLCHNGNSVNQSMCNNGDVGAPLMCKSHLNGPEKRSLSDRDTHENQRSGARFEEIDDNEGVYLYGLAEIVSPDMSCKGVGPKSNKELFLYLMPFVEWMKDTMDAFDEGESYDTIDDTTTANTTNATTVSNIPTTRPKYNITTTTLPEYYDTADYINTAKRAIRCKGVAVADKRLIANFHRSSYVVNQDNDRSLWSVATANGPFSGVVIFLLLLLLLTVTTSSD